MAMTPLLILASIADALLLILLIAVSGFVFGGSPEGLHGDPASVAGWTGAAIACLAAPVLGFVLKRRGKPGIGVLIAWLPPVGALVLTSGVFHPY
jgi:hypothetical protein